MYKFSFLFILAIVMFMEEIILPLIPRCPGFPNSTGNYTLVILRRLEYLIKFHHAKMAVVNQFSSRLSKTSAR